LITFISGMLYHFLCLNVCIFLVSGISLGQVNKLPNSSSRIALGPYVGKQGTADSEALNSNSFGIQGELQTDYGFAWRSSVFMAKEKSSGFLWSFLPSDLYSSEVFQVALEFGPSLRIVNFGRFGDWNLGGGVVLDYARATWISQIEHTTSAQRTIITHREEGFFRPRPFVESNLNFNFGEKWRASLSFAIVPIYPREFLSRSSSSGPEGTFYQRSDIVSSGDYNRFGISILYKIGSIH